MANRSMNFSVDSLRIGTNNVIRVFFPDRESSLAYIASMKKAHFMGQITPMVWQDGSWELDTEGLKAMSLPATLERQNLFMQASAFLKELSKSTDDMTSEQVSDLIDIMSSIAVVVSEATSTHVELTQHDHEEVGGYPPIQVARPGTYEEAQRYS